MKQYQFRDEEISKLSKLNLIQPKLQTFLKFRQKTINNLKAYSLLNAQFTMKNIFFPRSSAKVCNNKNNF